MGLAKDRRCTNSEEHHQMMLKPSENTAPAAAGECQSQGVFFFFFTTFFVPNRNLLSGTVARLATQLSDDRCASRCFDVHHSALPLMKGLENSGWDVLKLD